MSTWVGGFFGVVVSVLSGLMSGGAVAPLSPPPPPPAANVPRFRRLPPPEGAVLDLSASGDEAGVGRHHEGGGVGGAVDLIDVDALPDSEPGDAAAFGPSPAPGPSGRFHAEEVAAAAAAASGEPIRLHVHSAWVGNLRLRGASLIIERNRLLLSGQPVPGAAGGARGSGSGGAGGVAAPYEVDVCLDRAMNLMPRQVRLKEGPGESSLLWYYRADVVAPPAEPLLRAWAVLVLFPQGDFPPHLMHRQAALERSAVVLVIDHSVWTSLVAEVFGLSPALKVGGVGRWQTGGVMDGC